MSAPEDSQTLFVEIPRSKESTPVSFAQIQQFGRPIPNRARVECWIEHIPAIESHGNHFTNNVFETHEEDIAYSAETDHLKLLDCLQSQNSKLNSSDFVEALDSRNEDLSVIVNMAPGQAFHSKIPVRKKSPGPGPGTSTISGSTQQNKSSEPQERKVVTRLNPKALDPDQLVPGHDLFSEKNFVMNVYNSLSTINPFDPSIENEIRELLVSFRYLSNAYREEEVWGGEAHESFNREILRLALTSSEHAQHLALQPRNW